MPSPEASINFLREVLEFCDSCAARGYVVERVEADYQYFGAWSIAIGESSAQERRAIVFTWDAREGELAIKERIRDKAGLWPLKLIDERKIETSKGDDPFARCLEYLDR